MLTNFKLLLIVKNDTQKKGLDYTSLKKIGRHAQYISMFYFL